MLCLLLESRKPNVLWYLINIYDLLKLFGRVCFSAKCKNGSDIQSAHNYVKSKVMYLVICEDVFVCVRVCVFMCVGGLKEECAGVGGCCLCGCGCGCVCECACV